MSYLTVFACEVNPSCVCCCVFSRHRWRGHYSDPGQSLCSSACGDQTGLLREVRWCEYLSVNTFNALVYKNTHTRQPHITSPLCSLCLLRSWKRSWKRSWPVVLRMPPWLCWTLLRSTLPRSWGRQWRGRAQMKMCSWRSCARPPMRSVNMGYCCCASSRAMIQLR